MKRNRGGARLALGLLLGTLTPTVVTPVRGQEIKYSQDPDAEKGTTLLLKDCDRKPTVHLAQHDAPRAKFYVIDVHNHVNDPGGVHGDEVPAADVVKAMDQANSKDRDFDGNVGRKTARRARQDGKAVPGSVHGVHRNGLEQDRRS